MVFATALFDRATVERYAGYLRPGRVSLSRRIVDAVSRPVARMEAALGMGVVVDEIARRR